MHFVDGVRPPLKIGPEDAVVSTASDLAIGEHGTDEGGSDLVANSADGVERFEIRRREERTDRSRNDRRSAATILRHEQRVGRAGDSSRRSPAPCRRSDRTRVRDLNRRVEDVEAFEKEWTLLGKEEREALIGR